MKKIILLAIVSMCFVRINAQVISNDIKNQSLNKSIIIQKIDTIQSKEYDNIKDRLTLFSEANRDSHIFLGIGLLFYAGSAITNNSELKIPFLILGSASSIFGTRIYLDSYKYLNFKKKYKVRKIEWIMK